MADSKAWIELPGNGGTADRFPLENEFAISRDSLGGVMKVILTLPHVGTVESVVGNFPIAGLFPALEVSPIEERLEIRSSRTGLRRAVFLGRSPDGATDKCRARHGNTRQRVSNPRFGQSHPTVIAISTHWNSLTEFCG
jgi:hypothetical protein